MLMKVVENNGFSQKENFDIEFYEVIEETTNNATIETLRPLSFSHISAPNSETGFMGEVSPSKDKNYVEYYFDFLVDKEINDQMLCK